jgi:O-antigen ligase
MVRRASDTAAGDLRGLGLPFDVSQAVDGAAMTSSISGYATPVDWWRPARRRTRTHAPATVSSLAFGALVAFTAILLLSPQIWFPALGRLRIAFVAAAVAIGAHLADRMINAGKGLPISIEFTIALALVAWAVLTLPLSYWPAGSAEVLADHYLKALAFFWLIGTLAVTPRRLNIFAWTLVLCSIPLAATGVRNFIVGATVVTGVDGFRRIAGYDGGSGLTGNPNDLALMLNLIVPITGAMVFGARRLSARVLAAVALLLSVTAIVATFSRAGFLTLAVTTVAFLLVLARRRAALLAAAVIVLALAALPLLPAGYVERLGTITDIESDATRSAWGRWRDLQAAAGFVVEHPIVGAGIGQDILAMNDERGTMWVQVHNAYLQYGVDLGLLGLVLFVWLHVSCFRSAGQAAARAARHPARRRLVHLALGVQIALIAFGVAALFHPIAYQFYFFSIAGLAVALQTACREDITALPATEQRAS